MVKFHDIREIEFRFGFAVEWVEVEFVPFEQIHIDLDGFLDSRHLDGGSGIADHGERGCSQRRDTGAFE